MKTSRTSGRRTRREFLGDALRFGAAAAALAALGPQTASAAGSRPERVEVLLEDIVESTAADFARGQARGVEVAVEAGRAALRGKRGGVFTSGTRALSFPATHIGVHWVLRDAPPEALTAEVRTSADGAAWSDWQRLAIEAVEELPAGVEVFASLAGGRRGRFAQYRVSFGSDQITTVDRVTVTSINSVDGPREPLAATQATEVGLTSPGGNAITVTTREGWGCDETLRFKRGIETWPEMYVPAKKVVLHHTATTSDYTDAAAEVRAIYTYHTRTLRWGDIGYNSLIDKFGKVYEGRHGRGEGSGREILSTDVVAGHVYSHNYGSTGVAVIGDFTKTTIPVDSSTKLYGMIADVMGFECSRHGITPTGASDFLRSDDTWHRGLNDISGHDESYNTECPGTYLKAQLDGLKTAVASRLKAGPAPSLSSKSAEEQFEPGELILSWSGANEYCLEAWYKPSNSYDISYLQGFSTPVEYNDTLARVQSWTNTASSGETFSNLPAGHYTLHVRTASGDFESSRTFLVKKSSTSGKPPRRK